MPKRPTPLLVRAVRSQLELTQEELAEQIGVTTKTINNWENGRNRPAGRLALRGFRAAQQEAFGTAEG